MLAPLLYTVHLLSLPAKNVAVVGPTLTQELMEPALYRRPSTIALNSDGTVAFVVGKAENHAVGNMERIVVDRGTIRVFKLPARRVLAPFFVNPSAADLISVRNLAVSQQGKPIAALSMDISGAYGATQEASFAWNGAQWKPAIAHASGMTPKNIWVAAADADGGLAFVGDYLYLDPASLVNAHGDNLFDVAMRQSGGRVKMLGRGTITALSGTRAVGYDDGYVPGSNGAAPVQAVMWTGYRRSVFGPGIAWSINARGEAVGDDRATLRSAGVPMLWHNGNSIRLCNCEGTAFAITDDGAIVGDVKSGAFLVKADDGSRRMILLDNVVTGGWHITAAYYIAGNGDILAMASKGNAPPRLVLLLPIEKSRRRH